MQKRSLCPGVLAANLDKNTERQDLKKENDKLGFKHFGSVKVTVQRN